MDERLAYLSFSLASGIGPIKFKNLLDKFGTAQKAWEADKSDLKNAGLGPKTITVLDLFRNTFDVQKYVQTLEKQAIWFVAYCDKEYPESLRKLPNPPIVLFGRGDKSCLDSPKTVGVVGARKITSYGREVTESLVADLVSFGFTIISGMALGVDATAHESCLDSKGATIAVLGNGVDLPFPRENQGLYQKIIEQGSAIISEYPPGTNPSKGSFPARNRIIAALSLGVLVTEAGEDSGSLITADWSLKLNKKVFAVPGSINSTMSRGSLKLLKQGAVLVQSSKDILDEFRVQGKGPKTKKTKDYIGLNKDEIKICNILENESFDCDEIANRMKKNISEISILLSGLEINGVIKQDSGGYHLDR